MKYMEMSRYWGGSAFSKELNSAVLILLIAENKSDALNEYNACLQRYPMLKGEEPPEISEACNITMFLEEKSIYQELQTYKSAPVLHLSNLD